MAKSPLIRTTQYPYHITARSNNREWFYIPIEEVWRILLDILNRERVITKIRVHALVLMSNHFHLLASSTDGNIDETMRYLLREVCRRVNTKAERINHVFGGPYKWSVITNTSYYLHCLKYIYRNPVNAGICARVEEYPFSSIPAHRDPAALPFPIHQWKWAGDWMKWGDYNSILEWLNTPYPHGLADYLKKGFARPTFHIPKNRNTRKVPSYFWEELQPIYQLAPYPLDELT